MNMDSMYIFLLNFNDSQMDEIKEEESYDSYKSKKRLSSNESFYY